MWLCYEYLRGVVMLWYLRDVVMLWVFKGTETSKYLEEKKSTEIPLVAASERGTALKHIFN